MKFLALDQAWQRIGYAIGSPHMAAPTAGVFEPPAVGSQHGAALYAVQDFLARLIGAHEITTVCFESPFLSPLMSAKGRPIANPDSFAKANKLIGVIECTCVEYEVRCLEASPNEWRKHFLGTCTAPRKVLPKLRRRWLKDAAIHTCGERGWNVHDDDEADACGILDFALASAFPEYGARTVPLFGPHKRKTTHRRYPKLEGAA